MFKYMRWARFDLQDEVYCVPYISPFCCGY